MEQIQTFIHAQVDLNKTLEKHIRNDKKEPKVRRTATYYKNKIPIVRDLWEKFKVNHDYISLNPSAEPSKDEIAYNDTDLYSEFLEKYLEFVSRLEDCHNTLAPSPQISPNLSVPSTSTNMNNSNCVNNIVKLPRITLPTFSGDYTTWIPFKDLFLSLIDSQGSLANSQKLHYLKASLNGEAANLVKGFVISDSNYSVVWELLKNRYENTPALVNAHFDQLFNQTPASETSESIKTLLDSTVETVQGLENLKVPDLWRAVIVYMTVQRFPRNTRQIWEQQISDDKDLPTYEMMKTFLESRFRALEAIGNKSKFSKPSPTQFVSRQQSFFVERAVTCPVCAESHSVRKCPSFYKMSFSNKQDIVKRKGLCLNCLSSGHVVSSCPSKISCLKCRKRHHTLLHLNGNPETTTYKNVPTNNTQVFQSTINVPEITDPTTSSNQYTQPTLNSMHVSAPNETLLPTALIMIGSTHADQHVVRALVDQGSQATFITEHAAQMLRLPKMTVHASITGILKCNSTVQSKVNFRLITSHTKAIPVEAFVAKTITNSLPSTPVQLNWGRLAGLKLADPHFNLPGRIDVLLGADIYPQLIRKGLIIGPNGKSAAQNTIFGWILSGKAAVGNMGVNSVQTFTTTVTAENNDLSQVLQQFWNIEEIPHKRILTKDEEICEELYRTTHTRLDDGRYKVRLPFLSDQHKTSLGQSRSAAFASLFSLEKRLSQNDYLRQEYQQCINDYLRLGHMHLAKDTEVDNRREKDGGIYYSSYYLPHHAVLKESTTTKVRVVFDASRKSTSGLSLNSILSTGPTIQNEMIGVLLRWRKFKYAYLADIEKMYRQIKIHDEDTTYQRILWRNMPTEPVKEYCLNTVTFGVTCAPYLAIRTLNQLAHDENEKNPLASNSILNDFYVDDLLSGADELEDAILKQKQTREVLSGGGFKLRKWVANEDKILRGIPAEDIEIQASIDINPDNVVKSLGLVWYPYKDTFGYRIKLTEATTVKNKRELLSEIAKLFDPLGWISPLVIRAKLIMQSVWLLGLDWDQPLPENIQAQWMSFKAEAPILQELWLPRWIGIHRGIKQCQLHCFSDASQRAYAAVAYLRIVHENDDVQTHLLMSKTKVAPLKPVSIPRLELCGAVLASRLTKSLKEILQISNCELIMWTDSSIVLAWLKKHPATWTTFIANRTSEIITNIGNAPWYHVSSADNPADIASRGSTVTDLSNCTLWWHGPQWLQQHETRWPIQQVINGTDLELRKCIQTFHVEKENKEHNLSPLTTLIEKCSSLNRLINITSYVLRFIKRTRGDKSQPQWITTSERNKALNFWIKFSQTAAYAKEIYDLKNKKLIDSKSSIISLSPFLDDHELLRVKGRLSNSNLAYNERHPIIIPKDGKLTSLIISHYHQYTAHGGIQLMLNILRKRYWIVNARKTIKQIIHRCIRCYQHKAQTVTQLMGDLPTPRVTCTRPFTHTGIDYCGPISIKTSRIRNAKIEKGYLAIFICLAVKAIHLEVVSDLTSSAFLAAFKRFISRRGRCGHVYTDCGTNFIGANAVILDIKTKEKELATYCASEDIVWHFNPPSSPHFGGLWEAGVKSTKYHLRRILGNTTLTFEELCTVVAQVESCLNSRPLCPLTSDSSDLNALTPGHFLIGDALLAPPQLELLNINLNRLDRWQFCQQLVQQFWKRWTSEYLSRLQQRPKWIQQTSNIKTGTMVLIKDDNLPSFKWPLGRITDTHPGKDNLTRVVSVKTKGTVLKRPITKIAILPIQDNEGL